MSIAALQNLATKLRHAGDDWQRIQPENDEERDSIPPVKEKATAVIEALDALGAGTPPVPDMELVEPTEEFLQHSQSLLVDVVSRLDPLITADALPGRLADLQALKTRVNELFAVVGLAQGRRR